MEFCYTKEGMTQMLQDNLAKGYKRKRLKLNEPEEQALDSVKEEDMDIQDSEENTNDNPVQFPQPRPTTASDESNSTSMPDDVLQASLLELKQKQEEILKALEDASSDSNSTPSDHNEIPTDKVELESNETALITNDNNDDEQHADPSTLDITMDKIETAESGKLYDSAQNTPSSSATGHSRSSMFGTPLIKQVSPYSKLPGGEKWSVGVTDVIDFENLPDATGAYQKLTGVIYKVRTAIKRINDDTEHDSS